MVNAPAAIHAIGIERSTGIISAIGIPIHAKRETMCSHLIAPLRHPVTTVSTANFLQTASGVLTMADAPQRVQPDFSATRCNGNYFVP
jgi:hypothetical protein